MVSAFRIPEPELVRQCERLNGTMYTQSGARKLRWLTKEFETMGSRQYVHAPILCKCSGLRYATPHWQETTIYSKCRSVSVGLGLSGGVGDR